jgi:hypothetical protein
MANEPIGRDEYIHNLMCPGVDEDGEALPPLISPALAAKLLEKPPSSGQTRPEGPEHGDPDPAT